VKIVTAIGYHDGTVRLDAARAIITIIGQESEFSTMDTLYICVQHVTNYLENGV
jgi:hypothetical protein